VSERKPTIDDVLLISLVKGVACDLHEKVVFDLEVEWTEGIGGRGRVPIIINYG